MHVFMVSPKNHSLSNTLSYNTTSKMVERFVKIFLVGIFCTRTLSENVPEFQYPCYVDVCTFPTQFCNSDKYERRCSPCSRSICQAPNVPLACRYICMKHNELTTTPRPTTSTISPQQHQAESRGNDSLASVHLMMAYSVIATTLLVVVLLGFVAYYVHRKKGSKEKYRPVHSRSNIELDPAETLLNEITTCRRCGQRPRPEIQNSLLATRGTRQYAPPSYTSHCADPGIHAGASRTESTDSSMDSVNNNAKTQMVKPMRNIKMNTIHTKNDNEIRTRENSVRDAACGSPLLESLMDSNERQDSDLTDVKS